MATSAQYATTPAYFTGTAATADSSYTAPTNAVLIMTGSSTAAGSGVGHRIYRASAIVKGTSSAAVVRIFTSTDAGATFQLLGEAMIPAVTAGSSTPITDVSLPFLEGLVIPGSTGGNAFRIYATTSVTQNTAVHIFASAL
jgi:hypothetical protein